jgi:hypothetical protein
VYDEMISVEAGKPLTVHTFATGGQFTVFWTWGNGDHAAGRE